MRLKIILPVLILGVAIVAGAVLFASRGPRLEPVPTPAQQSAEAISSSNVFARPVAQRWAFSRVRPLVADAEDGSQAGEPPEDQGQNQRVRTRIAELDEMALSKDPDSLRAILRELYNPDDRIRKAAVDAAVQFKSPDAIPELKGALAQATDLDEEVHIQKAIDFLTLVSSSESTAANR